MPNAPVRTSTGGLHVTRFAPGFLALFALGCGEPTRPDPVVTILLSPQQDSVVRNGSVQFQATVRDAAGQPVSGTALTWRSSAPGVATVSPSGLTSAVSVGTTTISATSGTVTGTARLRVIAAPVGLRLNGPIPVLRVGQRIQLGATLRDDAGAEIAGRPLEWTSGNSAVAAVDSVGLVTGLAEGGVTITVRHGALSDSVFLTIGPTVAVTAADSLVVPGATYRIRGGGLDRVAVLVGGRQLAPAVATDTLLLVPIPDDHFGSCVADTTTTGISLKPAVGAAIDLRRPVAERPIVAALARGRRLDLANAHRTGCRVAIESAGDYVAMVYAAEAADSFAVRLDSLDLVFEVSAAGSSPVPATVAPSRPVGLAPAGLTGRVGDVVVSPAGASGAACPPATRIGDMIQMATERDGQGRVRAIAFNGPPVEAWELVGLASRVAFFVDTMTKRVMTSEPEVAALIGRTVAFADTGAVPFLERVTRGFPDKDQDGRVIAYVTVDAAVGAAGIALPWSSYRADCGVMGPPGESILLNLQMATSPVPPLIIPTLRQGVILHELAHIADLGWYPPYFGGHATIFEGFATFLQAEYVDRVGPEPSPRNREVYAEYPDTGILGCFVFPGLHLPSFYSEPHRVGCHLAGYLIARRRAATGESFRESAVRWSSTDIPASLPLWAERFLGQPGQGTSIFADWLLSWYSDDFVPGAGTESQQPYWNSRAGASRYLSSLPGLFPATNVGAGAARYPLRLGTIDARYFEFRASAATRLSLRGLVPPDARGKTGLMLLRR